jgi:hypothetical protein
MSAVVARGSGRQRKVRRKRKPLTCLRCGWTWVPYGRTMPARCANQTCRSPYWHTPRRERPEEGQP